MGFKHLNRNPCNLLYLRNIWLFGATQHRPSTLPVPGLLTIISLPQLGFDDKLIKLDLKLLKVL